MQKAQQTKGSERDNQRGEKKDQNLVVEDQVTRKRFLQEFSSQNGLAVGS